MSSKRLYFALLLAIAVGFAGLVGGAYAGDKLLSAKAQDLTTLKAKSSALGQERQALVTSKKQIEKYASLEKITRTVVPEDKNQAEAVGELVKIAAKNKISLSSITFPASTLGISKGASASTANGGAAAAVTGAGLGSGAGSAAANKNAALSQLQPISNIPGVYLLVITVQSDTNNPVPYSQFVGFLGDLERNRRTAQVSSITLSPNDDNRNKISFTLNINEYIKP